MKRRVVFLLGLASCLLFSVQAFAIDFGNAKAGGQVFQSRGCVNCHGQGGRSSSGQFPILAGQHADYLLHALKRYKEKARGNPIMRGQAAGLSQTDMENIAAYLSKQRSSLTIVK